MTIKQNRKWSFKLLQTEDRKRSDGRFPVALFLNFNGRKIITQDNLMAFPEEWDKFSERYFARVKSSKPNKDAEANNMYLDDLESKIKSIVKVFADMQIMPTNLMVSEKLNYQVKMLTVSDYINNYIVQLKSLNRLGQATIVEELVTYMDQFDKKYAKRVFAEIDYDYIKSFVQKQFDVDRTNGARKKGGVSVNIRALRSILNLAISDGVGCQQTYPFSEKYGTSAEKKIFCISKELKTKTRKRHIPINHLIKFFTTDFENIAHKRSKAYFFFSFFCGGINFVDMAKLTNRDLKHGFSKEGKPIKYFTYERAKTHESIEVVINDDIQKQIDDLKNNFQTIDDYLFPIVTTPNLNKEQLYRHIMGKRKCYNKFLKKMAKLLDFPEGLEQVSSYFARHSFAMTLLKKTKDIFVVSQSLHHSSVNTTKAYIEDFGADEIGEMTQGLLEQKTGGRRKKVESLKK